MRIDQIFHEKRPTVSLEFFPPKTEKGAYDLTQSLNELVPLEPSYVTVTYGAGGSTRSLTLDLVLRLHRDYKLTVASHLTCVGASQEQIEELLNRLNSNGIENLMVLRGDPPKGESHFTPHDGGFTHAGELVAFVKKRYPKMCVGVAGFPEGHPETPNRLKELEYLKAKVDMGADFICTQVFFDNHDFYDFCERCELIGIHVPIIAGIMPITSLDSMKRMAELALGTRYPADLLRAFSKAEDKDTFYHVGIEWAVKQLQSLIDYGVRGIHFYTMNRSREILSVLGMLGLTKLSDLVGHSLSA